MTGFTKEGKLQRKKKAEKFTTVSSSESPYSMFLCVPI